MLITCFANGICIKYSGAYFVTHPVLGCKAAWLPCDRLSCYTVHSCVLEEREIDQRSRNSHASRVGLSKPIEGVPCVDYSLVGDKRLRFSDAQTRFVSILDSLYWGTGFLCASSTTLLFFLSFFFPNSTHRSKPMSQFLVLCYEKPNFLFPSSIMSFFLSSSFLPPQRFQKASLTCSTYKSTHTVQKLHLYHSHPHPYHHRHEHQIKKIKT